MPFSLDPEVRPHFEETIKRSRFVARLRHVGTEAAAAEFLTSVRETERGAGHHCFAYVVGEQDDGRIERFSDDGEPGGTAGAPILNALKSRDLVNVAAVVSRYYGGVKLGTGGLARAYSGAVVAALDGVQLRPRVRSHVFRLAVDHAAAGRVESELRGRGFEIAGVDYRADVVFTIVCASPAALEAAVGELTSGSAELVESGQVWR